MVKTRVVQTNCLSPSSNNATDCNYIITTKTDQETSRRKARNRLDEENIGEEEVNKYNLYAKFYCIEKVKENEDI